MQLSDYCKQDAHSLAELIKAKQISPEQALDYALKRMHEVNPQLNAITIDCHDWALKHLQEMRGDEPFYGVPVLVKDLGFTLQGVPYSAGSRFFAGTVPSLTSDFIERLLEVGMLPFAKTNVPELGLSYVTESALWGPCRNPYDLTRTPGGSSGGSAAAVAAGVAPVATATDGGGSIRIPAACCGLFGFKPTPGLISTGPWVSEAWSGLAAIHVLTRSVRDSAFLFDLLRAPALAEVKRMKNCSPSQKCPTPLTIALLEDAFSSVPVAPPCNRAVEQMVDVLNDLGHRVIQHKLILDLQEIGRATAIIIAANTCANIEEQEKITGRQVERHEIEPITWEFMQRGKKLSAAELIKARNKIYQLTRPVHELLASIDLILTPALAQLPLKIGCLSMSDEFDSYLRKNVEFSPFTSLFNQAGLPAMTMPVMYHDRLPLSVQFAAGRGKDKLLLEFAMQLQDELPDFTQPVMSLHTP
ncbi:amidase [Legionella fairfieldensis]|uniref:amidase n=1 Tax=Legionella fairfieldensis TaxID=45064 RepID=UPI00048BEEB6|nr:amidase [Legionella fairfieldensis]